MDDGGGAVEQESGHGGAPPAPGRRPSRRPRRWSPATGRRLLAAAVAVLAVASVAAVVPRLGGDDEEGRQPGGGQPQPPVTLAPADPCATPASIRSVALGAPGDDWHDLALPPALRCYSLTAAEAGPGGVEPGSTFLLTSRSPLDAGDVRSRLRVEPGIGLEVTAEGEGLRVRPAEPLAEGTVYRFSLLDRDGGRALGQWSFQARARLRVVQTLPADEATGVPLDTGVEVTFSHDGVHGVAERLTIDPATPGRFETHKRTVVFVPARRLLPATLYTVTLAPGASVVGGLAITVPTTFRFETATGEADRMPQPPTLLFSSDFWEAPTGEAPVLGMFGGFPSGGPESVHLSVLRFASTDDFLASLNAFAAIPPWARLARDAYATPAAGLAEVAAFDGRVEAAGPSGEAYVRFPEPLPAGVYLVRADLPGGPAQVWLQVTDLAVYASVSERRTLVWARDLRAGEPAVGATVRMAGARSGFSARTGADGVALFDTPEGMVDTRAGALGVQARHAANLLVTAEGTGTAVVPLAVVLPGVHSLAYREFDFAGDPGPYWRYLLADRVLYHPGDTVHLWGLVRPREGPAPAGPVTLDLSGYDDEGRVLQVTQATAALSPGGTFLADLGLAGVAPGYYTVRASVAGRAVASTYVEVRDFVTPAYTLDVVPSAPVAFNGAEVRYDVTASFAEGTPVPGVRLTAHRTTGDPVEVTTDGSGRATVAVTVGSSDAPGYSSFDSLTVTPAVAEEGDIAGGAMVTVLPGAVLLDVLGERRETTGVVSGTAYTADLSKPVSPERAFEQAYRGAPAAGRAVTAEVVEVRYQAVETGDYYDFVAKQVRKSYRYDSVQAPVGSFPATTDGSGRFEVSFPVTGDSSYRVAVTAADDAGRVTRQEAWLGSGIDYPRSLHLVEETTGPYAVGAQVGLALRRETEVPPAGDGHRYLFVSALDGIRRYRVEEAPRLGFTFDAADVPGVSVGAVHFTGATFEEASYPLMVPFDAGSRRLRVDLAAGSGRHRPGEKATVDVRVTDAGGRPAAGADVVVSAVDERVYRLSPYGADERSDILGQLYAPVSDGVLGSYGTHVVPAQVLSSGAEAGEGGEVRSDYRDAALFTAVRTGADGRASVPFTLPSNLTSWRVTAVAVTDDLRAGTGRVNVPVGLPLFADVAMNDSYLVADRPVIRLRAFGDALAAGQAVAFRVESPTLLDAPLEATGTAFTEVDVALPALREGRHELTVRVTAGARSDALTRPLTVVRSRLVRTETRTAEVAAGSAWDPGAVPAEAVRVVLADHNRGRWYPLLAVLAADRGDRVEQALARQLAQEMLAAHFGEQPLLDAGFRGAAYQTGDGGVALLPYGDDDLAVTARLAAVAPDRFARPDLVRYLRGVLDDPEETRERAVMALSGLAGVGEPVLADLQAVAGVGDLTLVERLYAGLGAAALGDLATAEALYRSVLEERGQARGEAVRLAVDGGDDDIVAATALAATLGALLADDLSANLADYVAGAVTRDVVVDHEQAAFLAAALPRLASEPVRLSYNLGDSRKEEVLQQGQSVVVAVPPGGLAALDLRVAEGTLGVVRSAPVPVDPATIAADPALRLERTVARAGGGTRIRPSDLVRIELRPRLGAGAVDGCYRVSDLLPSGLRAVADPYQRGGSADPNLRHPYLIEGQRVSFCAFKGDNRPIVYYARVVSTGSYVVEPAILQAVRAPESAALSQAGQLDIG